MEICIENFEAWAPKTQQKPTNTHGIKDYNPRLKD